MKPRNPTRTRRLRLAALAFVALVLALFLPGPNGVVRVLGRHFRAARLARENRRLEREVDSLKATAKDLADPKTATGLARELLGSTAPDSTKPDSAR